MESVETPMMRSLRRLWGFILKESRQILRNRHLLYLLLIPPTIQLAILAYALRPGVDHMNLGIVDFSRSKESNELVSSLCSYKIFNPLDFGTNEQAMVDSLSKGSIGAAVVIPRNFSKDLDQGGDAKVQVLMDGVDAYSSGIAKSYIIQTFSQFKPSSLRGSDEKTNLLSSLGYDSQSLQGSSTPIVFSVPERSKAETGSESSELLTPPSKVGSVDTDSSAANSVSPAAKSSDMKTGLEGRSAVKTNLSVLYNPELRSSWYFIPGVLGGVITLVGILVSSAALLREREFGTLDQVLVSPYATWEIFVGKIAPIFVLLFADLFLALAVAMLLFQLPFRGDLSVFILSSILYLAVVIGFGMILSTTCAAQRQAQLASYLILIPVILLSGSLVPANTMPEAMQNIAAFNPLLHYTQILRSVLLKAGDWSILWQHVIVLAAFAAAEWTFCANRFLKLRS